MQNNHFATLIFFAIISLIGSTIFSGIIIAQNNNIISKLENK